MADRLTQTPEPEVINPHVHERLAGDWGDDDGQAMDDYFASSPAFNGPVESEGLAYAKEEIPVPTRIISRAIQVGTPAGSAVGTPPNDPVQVFPVDLRRLRAIIQADGNVVIGSDKSDVYNGALLQAPTQWTADGHTGALWVYSAAATPVNVVVWSITK